MAAKPLVIVESPAKAKILGRFLGNKYRVEADEAIEVLRVDNADVLAQQKAKLEELRSSRNADEVTEALRRLTDAARGAAEGKRDGGIDSNLLKLAVDAGASDLHLKVGSYPMMRVRGALQSVGYKGAKRAAAVTFVTEAGQTTTVRTTA